MDANAIIYLLKYSLIRRANMRKIRILALLLAVLMIPFSLLVACKKDNEDDPCADGHDWNKKEVTIEKRTCTTSGIKERTCRVCKLTEQYEWKPEGHTISKAEWVYNEDATCTEDGHETRSCALCTYSETRVKPGTALGHIFTYYALSEDGYSETAVCDICSTVTHTRLVGIKIDFEGEKNTLSYDAFTVYTPAGVTDYYKTEGEGETFNSYLQIDRTADIGIGDHGYGAFFAPGYIRLKANKYVVDFEIKISENTGDMVLLSGQKDLTSVDFLTYDAETKTISITYGPLYTLKADDFDRWMKLSIVLNDIERKYEFYIDDKLVIANVDYQNDEYFAGMDLESFKIAMTHEPGVASTFALDDIDIYIENSPKGYKGGTLAADYEVFETQYSKTKIMYKKLGSCASHTLGSAVNVDATCFIDGYSYKECSVCHGRTEFATTAQKLNHIKDGVSQMQPAGSKPATCTEYGANYTECSLCHYKDREVVAMLPHVINTGAASYLNKPADCLNDGVITGECIACKCPMSQFNGEYKYGHNVVNIEVVQTADCIRDGYSTGTCINPGCGLVQTVDEIPALGHVMKTRIVENSKGEKVIENFCLRCKDEDYTTSQPLSVAGKFPTPDEVKAVVGDNYYASVEGSGFSNGEFVHDGQHVSFAFKNNGEKSSASRINESGNYFLRIKQVPDAKECYVNILDGNRRKYEDVVVELSLRAPATGTLATGTMSAAQRITGHNVVFNVFSIESDGSIKFIPGNCIIGKINSTEFSKLSFVIKPGTGAVDAYFNGELKCQNAFMKAGQPNFVPEGGDVYEFRLSFGTIPNGERGIDVDDLYMYAGSLPVYITNPFVPDATERNYDVEKNTGHSEGPYIKNNSSGVIGTYMQISSGQKFRAYAEEIAGISGSNIVALHCTRGDEVASIVGATSSSASEISCPASVMKSGHSVIYNELKFNDGSFTAGKMNSGTVILAQSIKKISADKTQNLLVLKDGDLYTGDGKYVFTVQPNVWFSYNIVINEIKGTYDVYVDGICRVSGAKFAAECIADAFTDCRYKFLIIDSGNFDFYMANTSLHAGAVAPVSDVTVGELEKVFVTTEVTKKHDAVVFYEDRSISSYYDYVGKVIGTTSLSTLTDATKYAKKEAVSIAKIDNKVVLRTTDYETNNLKAIEFKTLLKTKLANGSTLGTYDLSGYDYLTLSFNVEATNGYNIILKLMTAEGYYQMRVYVANTGWHNLMLPLKANTEEGKENLPYFKKVGNASGDLKDVISLRIEFEGDIAGSGNGALMDGTTISFEKIGFENELISFETVIGENLDTGNFCEDHGENYVDTVIAPTCKSTGYTKRVCSVCGHIAKTNTKPPLEEQRAGNVPVSTQDCLNDEIKIAKFTCECGKEDCIHGKDYYKIVEYIPKKDHDVVEGSCTICGKAVGQ